jgi:hypothetical protein
MATDRRVQMGLPRNQEWLKVVVAALRAIDPARSL